MPTNSNTVISGKLPLKAAALQLWLCLNRYPTKCIRIDKLWHGSYDTASAIAQTKSSNVCVLNLFQLGANFERCNFSVDTEEENTLQHRTSCKRRVANGCIYLILLKLSVANTSRTGSSLHKNNNLIVRGFFQHFAVHAKISMLPTRERGSSSSRKPYNAQEDWDPLSIFPCHKSNRSLSWQLARKRS